MCGVTPSTPSTPPAPPPPPPLPTPPAPTPNTQGEALSSNAGQRAALAQGGGVGKSNILTGGQGLLGSDSPTAKKTLLGS